MGTRGLAAALSAAALLAGLAGAASAAGEEGEAKGEKTGTTPHQAEAKYKPENLRTLTLTVKEVDPEKHKVTFEATVKPEATNSSGQPIRLDSLREGDTVRAAFDPKTGDVVRVDVTPGKAKK